MNFPFSRTSRRLPPRAAPAILPFQTDVFAPVLPGQHESLDALERSIRLLRGLAGAGVRKAVGVVPVMNTYYPHTAERIQETFLTVRAQLQADRIPLDLIPAAAYYIDQGLMRLLYQQTPLLTFGDPDRPYLLFETGLLKAPAELDNVLWAFRMLRLTPIMAHPEHCLYLQQQPERLFRLKELGVQFQVNLLSLVGKPTPGSRRLAEWMIDHDLVTFLGSGLSQEFQLPLLEHAVTLPHFCKALEKGLDNHLV